MKYLLIIAICAFAICGCRKDSEQKTFDDQTCKLRLRMIYEAKQHWAERNQKPGADTPTWEDLRPYLRGAVPKCPSGGVYTIGRVDELPKCSIPGHAPEIKPPAN